MTTASTPETKPAGTSETRVPLRGWALEFARRWNAGTYSLFILHGNIFDLFCAQRTGPGSYLPLKSFLARRVFPERGSLLFFDIGEGLTFGSAAMQKSFFEWLAVYDEVEHTNYHQEGPPRDFGKLVPLLRRFFQKVAEEKKGGVTLLIDFAEKLVPSAEEASASSEERFNLVTLLKWASAPEFQQGDVGIVLLTESANELHADLLQNPHVAQVRIELPDAQDRELFLESEWLKKSLEFEDLAACSDFSAKELSARTAGLNLLRIHHFLAEGLRNQQKLTAEWVAVGKKRLIEEFCQGLVRFKEPKPGVSLDWVASHEAAKKKLRELAWLIKNQKTDVLERGILVPGRVGVGKSFLIDCFASECGLPVMEIGEFRSKWVGDTERQQMRILMTVRALGPVIVVVDEADAVFGGRHGDGDSGVSSRVFAAFAAHIGDSSLRGREVWVAMTSRPDMLAIDMKRQGRFGLCLPLFPAQGPEDVLQLFSSIAKVKKISLNPQILEFIKSSLGNQALTGSEVEAILVRAKERAVLEKRDSDVRLEDLQEAIQSFIDPLDPHLIRLQNLAAILACSDKRYLPLTLQNLDRSAIQDEFDRLKGRADRRF